MDIPPLHICNALTGLNEELNIKYKKLTRKYKQLQLSFDELKGELMKIHIEQKYKTQSLDETAVKKEENVKTSHCNADKEKKRDSAADKLLLMHNKLIKQLDKECRLSSNQAKKLQTAEAENEKLKFEIFQLNQQNDFIRKQLESKESHMEKLSAKLKDASSQDHTKKLITIKQDKNKLIAENKRLKDELKVFDQRFFDEIEDMKYALQQSVKLNTQYEKALRCLCKRFGVNYEKTLFDKNIDNATEWDFK